VVRGNWLRFEAWTLQLGSNRYFRRSNGQGAHLADILDRFLQTRAATERLCQPLVVEDFVVQSMPDASPARWHLAHTTWFYEAFVLARCERDYRPFNEHFHFLFNSYYNRIGQPFPRAQRGLLTRPTVAEVFDYRHAVDQRMTQLLRGRRTNQRDEALSVVELGINHEQQHQELILTDIKHLFSCNPLAPAYQPPPPESPSETVSPCDWKFFAGGLASIGHEGNSFAYDNEGPRHVVFLRPFELQLRLITVGEFLDFINDGGYDRPELWLSLGWTTVCEQKWKAPLYWIGKAGDWRQFTLYGLMPLSSSEPVCHVSYFEADAFARWSGARLSTEAEWEHAAATDTQAEEQPAALWHHHPRPAGALGKSLSQLYGDVWQWTSSPYTPYPGYIASADALGEYNGKFMCNQYVLRGGSCATPAGHTRPTYRNFFPPDARWQFTGIRLARDAK
jgi:ergothioneine biosynthesis protein EgtB